MIFNRNLYTIFYTTKFKKSSKIHRKGVLSLKKIPSLKEMESLTRYLMILEQVL